MWISTACGVVYIYAVIQLDVKLCIFSPTLFAFLHCHESATFHFEGYTGLTFLKCPWKLPKNVYFWLRDMKTRNCLWWLLQKYNLLVWQILRTNESRMLKEKLFGWDEKENTRGILSQVKANQEQIVENKDELLHKHMTRYKEDTKSNFRNETVKKQNRSWVELGWYER